MSCALGGWFGSSQCVHYTGEESGWWRHLDRSLWSDAVVRGSDCHLLLVCLLLLQSSWLWRWRGDLCQGLFHLILILEAMTHPDELLEEGVTLLALVDSRVFDRLPKKLLRMVHDLQGRVFWSTSESE